MFCQLNQQFPEKKVYEVNIFVIIKSKNERFFIDINEDENETLLAHNFTSLNQVLLLCITLSHKIFIGIKWWKLLWSGYI